MDEKILTGYAGKHEAAMRPQRVNNAVGRFKLFSRIGDRWTTATLHGEESGDRWGKSVNCLQDHAVSGEKRLALRGWHSLFHERNVRWLSRFRLGVSLL
jgi:hypothetical protein